MPAQTIEKDAEYPSGQHPEGDAVRAWLKELDEARGREADWRKDADALLEVYEGAKSEEVPFNILYSNTETLSPALYNNTPRPVVKPRYKRLEPMPKAAAGLTEAYLEYFLDSGDPDQPSFDDLMRHALHEALVPGRGLIRYRYDAEIQRSEAGAPEKVARELVYGEPVNHNRILHGFAQKWEDVPWLAFEHPMPLDEARDLFPDQIAGIQRLDSQAEGMVKVADSKGVSFALLYEIWDKKTRKIFWVSEGGDRYLKKDADPLGLDGFFPVTKPLQFVTKLSSMVPVPLYAFYRNQAEELNEVTNRIRAIIRAVKATGGYNSQVDGLAKILELEDGKLEPIDNLAAIGDGAGLDKAVWLWPVEKLVSVLQQLYTQRAQIKQVIYEITGISDILRGASVASETATAQQLKNQWGSLRIRRFQKAVAHYVQANLRLIAELSFKRIAPETIGTVSGSSLPPAAQKAQAQALVQQLEQQRQQALLLAAPAPGAGGGGAPPGPGLPGQGPSAAPQPAPIPPEVAAIAASPALEEVVSALASDVARDFLISIETNSTVDAEATEDKQNLTEYLSAMAQFFGGIGPLVKDGTLPFPAAKEMLLAVSRKYRLGRELDDQLATMQAPAQPGGADAAKVQKESEALSKEREAFQKEQQSTQLALQKEKFQLEIAKAQFKMQQLLAKMELQVQGTKQKSELQQIQVELQTMLEVDSARRAADAQVTAARQQGALVVAGARQRVNGRGDA